MAYNFLWVIFCQILLYIYIYIYIYIYMLYVGSSWSPCFCSAMSRGLEEIYCHSNVSEIPPMEHEGDNYDNGEWCFWNST